MTSLHHLIYEVDSESSETLASTRNISSKSFSYESHGATNCPIIYCQCTVWITAHRFPKTFTSSASPTFEWIS